MTKTEECKRLKAHIGKIKKRIDEISTVISSRDLKILKDFEDTEVDEAIDIIRDMIDDFYVDPAVLKSYRYFKEMSTSDPNFDIRRYKHLVPKVEKMKKEKIPYFLRKKND